MFIDTQGSATVYRDAFELKKKDGLQKMNPFGLHDFELFIKYLNS